MWESGCASVGFINGGCPLSRQKFAARSFGDIPIPGSSESTSIRFRSRRAPSPAKSAPSGAPNNTPTPIMTNRVAQSLFAAENSPISAPAAMKPTKIAFRICPSPAFQTIEVLLDDGSPMTFPLVSTRSIARMVDDVACAFGEVTPPSNAESIRAQASSAILRSSK